MDKHTKIIFLITGLHSGGAEHHIFEVAKALKKIPGKKYDITVCSILSGGVVATKLRKENIRTISLGSKGITDVYSAYKKLKTLLKKEQPDVLHCYLFHANLLGRFAAKGLKCKVISSIRVKLAGPRFEHLIDTLTQSLVDVNTVNSNTLFYYAQSYGLSKKKLVHIDNGIDVASIQKKAGKKSTSARQKLFNLSAIDAKRPIILAVAHLRKQKDYPTLLRAFALLKKSHDAQLCIAGSATDYENEYHHLQQIIREESLSDVHFLGNRNDVPQLLKNADVYVSATLYEGQSNSLLQAMACASPIVTTDISENAEVVRHNKEALLVPPKNPAKLAQALVSIVSPSQKKKTKSLSQKAYKRVSSAYSFSSMIQKMRSLYVRN